MAVLQSEIQNTIDVASMHLVIGYCRICECTLQKVIHLDVANLCLSYYHSIRFQTYSIDPPIKYYTLSGINGSYAIVENVKHASYGTFANVCLANGQSRLAKIVEADKNKVCLQMYQGSAGICTKTTHFQFSQSQMKIPVSKDMFGRIFDGIGNPADSLPPIEAEKLLNIYGKPINPLQRDYPRQMIETGISIIDTMISISCGQKIAFMSGTGLPHNQIIAQIVRQCRLRNTDQTYDDSGFCIIFAGIGISIEAARYFKNNFIETGITMKTIMFLNLINDQWCEQLLVPHIALTTAEYFAYECSKNVLVILNDMTNFSGSYRVHDCSSSRRRYAFNLKQDLSAIYERAGIIKGCKGSITIISVITMPNDKLEHTVSEWNAECNDGIIYMDRCIYNNNIFPPINFTKSMSYSMQYIIKQNITRGDHLFLVNQIQRRYIKGKYILQMEHVIGNEALSNDEKLYLEFKELFETEFVKQCEYEHRCIAHSLKLLWRLITIFENRINEPVQSWI
eukprot:263913_1